MQSVRPTNIVVVAWFSLCRLSCPIHGQRSRIGPTCTCLIVLPAPFYLQGPSQEGAETRSLCPSRPQFSGEQRQQVEVTATAAKTTTMVTTTTTTTTTAATTRRTMMMMCREWSPRMRCGGMKQTEWTLLQGVLTFE